MDDNQKSDFKVTGIIIRSPVERQTQEIQQAGPQKRRLWHLKRI